MTPAHAGTPATDEPAPGITLLISRPGEDPRQASHGYANLEHKVPISAETRFNVGSVAKQITAHLVLLAAEEGRLDLDRPADTLLPELRVPEITPADLITHHSGLRDAESLLPLAGYRDLDHYTSDDLLSVAGRQQQRAVPQGQFLYSNTNYLLLARLLERLHDRPFAAIAEDLLFGPLGMTASCFKVDPREALPDTASAYEPSPGGWQHVAAPAVLPGPGSLWTTTGDLSRWLTHLHSLWTKNGTPNPHHAGFSGRSSDHSLALYGAGLYALPDEVLHHGHEQGFAAATHITRDGHQVISLSNGGALRADLIAEAASFAPVDAMAVIAQPPARLGVAPPAPSSRPAPERQTELGRYACPEIPGSLRVTAADGALYIWRRGTPSALIPTATKTYQGEGMQLVLSDKGAGPDLGTFVLSMQRAPALEYHLL